MISNIYGRVVLKKRRFLNGQERYEKVLVCGRLFKNIHYLPSCLLECTSSSIEFELSHMTQFGEWKVSRHEVNKVLTYAWLARYAFLHLCHQHENMPHLAYQSQWEDKIHRAELSQLTHKILTNK